MAAGAGVCHDRGVREGALFTDRRDAGRVLAAALVDERRPGAVVVGLARGGVVVAAEVARVLGLPLDVVAVRKVGHPWQPEYALGAVAPDDGVYVRGPDGLSDEELAAAVEAAKARAVELDRTLHAGRAPVLLEGRPCLLVDDGLATGATMIAAVRWARGRKASRVVAAVPVGASQSAAVLRREADAVVCPHELSDLGAVGVWYGAFDQVEDTEVVALLERATRDAEASAAR